MSRKRPGQLTNAAAITALAVGLLLLAASACAPEAPRRQKADVELTLPGIEGGTPPPTTDGGAVTPPGGEGGVPPLPSDGGAPGDVGGASVDSGPSADSSAPPVPLSGIWISHAELAKLPTGGPAWNQVLDEANKAITSPDLSLQNSPENTRTLAKALVYARTGTTKCRDEVIAAIMAVMGTENSGTTLALGRNLAAYVIAADLVGMPSDKDQTFRSWIKSCLTKTLGSKTLISTHEIRPNNWGTMAGASRAAVAVYLGDTKELARTAEVFKGWLGDRSSYAGFKYGALDWQCDPAKPVGINPKGCTKQGHSIDGVLPDDQRRAGGFSWPPPKENYVYSGLAGALAQAHILHRAGYDVWNWEDKALLRAFNWLHDQASFPAVGDDEWQPWLINHVYGASFPAPAPAQEGKNVGWTDWTLGTGSVP